MPSPPPISCQLARSAGVPWASRGYQAIGAEIVRPSERTTLSASSLAVAATAQGCGNSATEKATPCLQERLRESPARDEPKRIEPELGDVVVTAHVDGRLAGIRRIEEEPVRRQPEARSASSPFTYRSASRCRQPSAPIRGSRRPP